MYLFCFPDSAMQQNGLSRPNRLLRTHNVMVWCAHSTKVRSPLVIYRSIKQPLAEISGLCCPLNPTVRVSNLSFLPSLRHSYHGYLGPDGARKQEEKSRDARISITSLSLSAAACALSAHCTDTTHGREGRTDTAAARQTTKMRASHPYPLLFTKNNPPPQPRPSTSRPQNIISYPFAPPTHPSCHQNNESPLLPPLITVRPVT